MFNVISIELYKIFKKWRTYIGFIVVSVLVPLIQIAMFIEGQKSINFMTRNLQQSFMLVGNLLNSYLVSFFILNSLAIHIPFLIALVTGDLLAGEATAGTYRILLTRPISRFTIVTAKFSAGIVYTFLLISWLAIMSLGLGTLIFGTGELLNISNGVIIILAKNDILWRFFLSYAFAVLSMSVVASLAFMFSALVENAIGPIISTMAIIIIFMVVSAINIDIFQVIKPYLFTNYMSSWRGFFDNPIDFSEIIKSSLILFIHIVVFYSTALFLFNKKDILS